MLFLTNSSQHIWECELPILDQLNNPRGRNLYCELGNIILKCGHTNLVCHLFNDAKLAFKSRSIIRSLVKA